MHQHPLRSTVLLATCLVLLLLTSPANATRKLRRRSDDAQQPQPHRQLNTEELGTSSLCKSVIAVGGTRLLHSTQDNTIQDLGNGIGDFHFSYLEETEYETDEEFVCELSDGNTIPLIGSDTQMAELRMLLNKGTLISSESTVQIDFIGQIESGIISGVSNVTEEVATLPPGDIKLVTTSNNEERRLRRLNQYEGTKNTLVYVSPTQAAGNPPRRRISSPIRSSARMAIP